ncbi:MAG: hypothetical protein ACKOXB_06540 [Flavobacteriales bacterium]
MKHRIFEKIWLVVLALCVIIFIYTAFRHGINEAYIWLIWIALALLFYFRRRSIRMKLTKEDQ